MYEINPMGKVDETPFFSRYKLPSKLFYITCAAGLRMTLFHENDPSEAAAAALATKMQAVNDAMLSKFRCSKKYAKEYKMAINSNSENVDAIYRNLYEFLFMDLYLADNVSLLSYAACDAGNLLAQKIVIDAYHNGNLPDLLDAIGQIKDIISPYRFCVQMTSDGQFVLPEMDICCRDDLSMLANLLGACASEHVFQLIYSKTLTDESDTDYAAITAARKNKKEIERLLNPFITGSFRKKAEKAFITAAAAQYEYIVNTVMERGFRNIMLDSEPTVLTNPNANFKMGSKDLFGSEGNERNIKVFRILADIYNEIRDAGMYEDEKQTRKIFGDAMKDPELANIGFWFCLNNNDMWGVGTMLSMIANSLTFRTHFRGQFGFDIVCPKSYRMEGKPELRKHSTGLVKRITDLFVSKDIVPRESDIPGDSIQLTYNQLLCGFGLRICDTHNFRPDEEDIECLANNLTRVGPFPDDIAGALTAISILDFAGMLSPTEKDKTELEELAQAVETTQKQVSDAQRKIKELEAQLTSKDRTIQRKDNELFDNSRALAAKDKEIASMKDDEEELRQQVAELTEILAHVDDDEVQDVSQIIDPDIVTPYNIVVCGGTERFANLLKEQLSTIKTYCAGQAAPADVLRNADVVFVQTSYIAHKQYYPIRNICRACGTRVEFFRKRGAQTVAAIICEKILQIAHEIQKAS